MSLSIKLFAVAVANFLVPNKDHSIVIDGIVKVVDESPALFPDDLDKRKTTSLLFSIAKRESNLNPEAIGDHGTSFCHFQINKSIGGSEDLLKDAYKCTRKAFDFLQYSIKLCPRYPVAVYASGHTACDNNRAQRISNDRMNLAKWLVNNSKEVDNVWTFTN